MIHPLFDGPPDLGFLLLIDRLHGSNFFGIFYALVFQVIHCLYLSHTVIIVLPDNCLMTIAIVRANFSFTGHHLCLPPVTLQSISIATSTNFRNQSVLLQLAVNQCAASSSTHLLWPVSEPMFADLDFFPSFAFIHASACGCV